MTDFAEPTELAVRVASMPRPLLLGLDIDGVLAPIVRHADDSELLPGVTDALGRLVELPGVFVAAVSGRGLASVRTFGFPAGVLLVGSHGMERGDRAMRPLDDAEAARLGELDAAAREAARRAGEGAWVEEKTASVVLHVREAERDRAADAIEWLDTGGATIPGAEVKHGDEVLELFARSASKGAAMAELVAETDAATAVFVGDDVTDEEAFAALRPSDVAVKVGTADTMARHRLRDPAAVLGFLGALGDALGAQNSAD